MPRRHAFIVLAAAALLAAATAGAARLPPGPPTAPLSGAALPPAKPVDVTVELDRTLATFAPGMAIGGALDGHAEGETAQIYTPHNLRSMGAAGLGAVTYRLRTELGDEAWHFDPAGSFSAGTQGYWRPSSRPTRGLRASFGYALPRRGDTHDQADDHGYSRLDDGSLRTFWKSDPYLDPHFTGDAHPQWVLLDLARPRPVDALRLAWAAPYARSFRVQWYTGPSAIILNRHPPGRWRDFPRGRFPSRGGTQTVRLSDRPLAVRYVRVLMQDSSHTAAPGSRDVRDRLGFALRELWLGTARPGGRLVDLVRHAPQGGVQTAIYVSSTDPWHRASDRDPGYEQPSVQTVMRSGLTRGLPVLVPVPVLYGTPSAAVAELRMLRALHVPVRGVELGEEPDGQLASPEDYGALYLQFARAIHAAFPSLPLGGPGFQTSIPEWLYWPDAHGDRSWMRRFLQYLRAHHGLRLLRFFSFEWYPFDNVCDPAGPELPRASAELTAQLAQERADGLPAGLPVYITEYGFSAFAGQPEVDLPGALFDADTAATALEDGVRAAFLYGYEPDAPMLESGQCASWGNLVLLESDASHRAEHPLADFWAMQMVTRDWSDPAGGEHRIYATSSDARDGAGRRLVRVHALRRPDGRLSLLLLNLSPSQPYLARLSALAAGVSTPLAGPWREWQLSGADWAWAPAGARGRPALDAPPLQATLPGGPAQTVALPPYSLTVLDTDTAAAAASR
jgi:F5/8 type C domain